MYTTINELYESYDDAINECCAEWATPARDAATTMKEQDNTMYRCGFTDYVDGLMEDGEISEELAEELGYKVEKGR